MDNVNNLNSYSNKIKLLKWFRRVLNIRISKKCACLKV
jgi:hypothetical protein